MEEAQQRRLKIARFSLKETLFFFQAFLRPRPRAGVAIRQFVQTRSVRYDPFFMALIWLFSLRGNCLTSNRSHGVDFKDVKWNRRDGSVCGVFSVECAVWLASVPLCIHWDVTLYNCLQCRRLEGVQKLELRIAASAYLQRRGSRAEGVA